MKVSVIVPVYNVYDWLDACMESIVNQSFRDFEIILIEDGSTDGSDLKCEEWAKSDQRVKVLKQKNSGPSIARNKGMKVAKGEYLSFIDSDDWVDKDFLKKMYDAASQNDADMVECDVYRVDDRTGERTYRVCSGNLGQLYTAREHMKYGYTAIWKCLVRKELFLKYEIEFPDCHSEAKAIYPLLLALSNKIINVSEGLYFYRRFRKDSLTAKPRQNNGDEFAIGIRAFDALLQGFIKNGIYQKYSSVLEETVKFKLSDMLAATFYRRDKDEYKQLVGSYQTYIAQKFPDSLDYTYATVGGYNLNRILWNMNMLHNPYCRFNFSSLIGIMHPINEKLKFYHKNKYRMMMICRDFYSEFWDVMKEESPQYLCMDFIEERFDVIQYKDSYITKSDAFDGADFHLTGMHILSRRSKECMDLWKKSCIDFIYKLQTEYPTTKIILIKTFLCEQYGSNMVREDYPNHLDIREMNRILEAYYQFFANKCPSVTVIEVAGSELYFTDENYEYGKLPSHLNDLTNREIAAKIEAKIIGGIS
ncbi:Glycosyltransferase involved in cell wall bisynthesis [Lacrimispora sphenoides]|jgi:glycosyltransferase involved in cell wall biosynthesis|uniref:glycosyltransferase n=1 Tax=Lacrimispora sphenoides TaxID=29370 RepID=UPI0008C44D10|nr:glycosyltransferase [Lacrimispora sphenoides]SET94870.1 Glycosyltransferase involved in cell wall bisynthesis [Lacrimispora sphenoides]